MRVLGNTLVNAACDVACYFVLVPKTTIRKLIRGKDILNFVLIFFRCAGRLHAAQVRREAGGRAPLRVVLGLHRQGMRRGTNESIVEDFFKQTSKLALFSRQVLGPKGYCGVQVSPPQEHIPGSEWWTRYQPVSYILSSRSGNRRVQLDCNWSQIVQVATMTGISSSRWWSGATRRAST